MKANDKLIFEQYQAVTENKWQNPVVDEVGSKYWYNEQGQLHRDDGPAYMGADGSKMWYKNSMLHREDGPAIEDADGSKTWYINGERYHTILEWTRALFIYKGHTPEELGQEKFNDLVRAFAQKIESMYED